MLSIPIPIKSGPIDLRIRGFEGMTAQDVLDRTKNGARFVLYQYVLSFVSISFRKPSDIFCIQAGRSKLVPGLRYSLLSMLAGWWSLAGIVFTIKALIRNFRGGFDVTEEVVEAFSAAPAGSAPRLILENSRLVLPPPVQPAVFDPARAANAAANRKRDVRFVLLLGAIITAIAVILLVYRETHYPLALVNGIDKPYTVNFDGRNVPLPAGDTRVLAVTVGKHTARAILPDGAEYVRQFEVGADWYDPSTPLLCTIVNPDRRALIAEQHRVYGGLSSVVNLPTPRIWASHDVLTIKRPYFFFEEFPPSVEAPEGSKDNLRNQIAIVPHKDVDESIRLLIKYGTREDLHDYRDILSARRSTEPR